MTTDKNSSSKSTLATGVINNNNNNDSNAQEHLSGNRSCAEFLKRDIRLLLITLLIIIFINIPILRWIVYPFTIFSTYIHELCHGIAAIFVGGKIDKIMIYPDGSGLCYSSLTKGFGFVASAGYQGTSVVGCVLMLFRQTKRGPRAGTATLGFFMVLSVALWIRNVFGALIISFMGVFFGLAAWKLSAGRIRDLYTCIAATTVLNALTSVKVLFGSNFVVNGQESRTDAHSMADIMGGSRFVWATLWLAMAVLLSVVGLIFAIPGPDEAPLFRCCGVFQKFRCFDLCNYQRPGGDSDQLDIV